MRRHRLASRAAKPACPASSSPPSGSASHTATAATPVAARASSSSAAAMPVPSAAVSMAAAASPLRGAPLTAGPAAGLALAGPGAAETGWPLLARAAGGWPVICAASSARLVPDSADRCSSCSWASAGEQPSRSISMPRARSTTDRAAAADCSPSSSCRWRAISALSRVKSAPLGAVT